MSQFDESDHESSFEIVDSDLFTELETNNNVKALQPSSEGKIPEDVHVSDPESSFEARNSETSESPDPEAWRLQVTSVERNLHIGHLIDALTYDIDPKEGLMRANLIAHAIKTETELFEISESRQDYFEQVKEEIFDITKERNVPEGPRDVPVELRNDVIQQILSFSIPEPKAQALEMECFQKAKDRNEYCGLFFNRVYMEEYRKKARKPTRRCDKASKLRVETSEASEASKLQLSPILQEMNGCWEINFIETIGDYQDISGITDFSCLMGAIVKISTVNDTITLSQYCKSGYFQYRFRHLITPKNDSSTDYVEDNQWVSVSGDRSHKCWIQDGQLRFELYHGNKSLKYVMKRTEDTTKYYTYGDFTANIFAAVCTIFLVAFFLIRLFF